MKRIARWLGESNRWKHLAGGAALGALTGDPVHAAVCVTLVASALEFKDKSWGGRWDWTDWALTVAGGAVGIIIRMAL